MYIAGCSRLKALRSPTGHPGACAALAASEHHAREGQLDARRRLGQVVGQHPRRGHDHFRRARSPLVVVAPRGVPRRRPRAAAAVEEQQRRALVARHLADREALRAPPPLLRRGERRLHVPRAVQRLVPAELSRWGAGTRELQMSSAKLLVRGLIPRSAYVRMAEDVHVGAQPRHAPA